MENKKPLRLEKNQVFFCLGKEIKVEGECMRRGCLRVFFLTTFYVTVLSVSLLLTTQSLCLTDLMVDPMFTTKMSCWQRPNHLTTWSDIASCHTPYLNIRYNIGQLDILPVTFSVSWESYLFIFVTNPMLAQWDDAFQSSRTLWSIMLKPKFLAIICNRSQW